MLRKMIAVFRVLLGGGRKLRIRRREKAMRLCEMLPLGDRRMLALVLVEGHKFLVGAAANSVSLVACIPPSGEDQDSVARVAPQPAFDPEEWRKWQ